MMAYSGANKCPGYGIWFCSRADRSRLVRRINRGPSRRSPG